MVIELQPDCINIEEILVRKRFIFIFCYCKTAFVCLFVCWLVGWLVGVLSVCCV